jgi:predicted DCC family thiol-disulfide oxidoreductase YuxK
VVTTVVFYDGVCGLCNHFLRFLIRRDPRQRLAFAPLQGTLAKTVLVPRGIVPSDLDSIYVIADWRTPSERLLNRSRALIHVLFQLGGVWRLAARGAAVLPTSVADRVYDFVAVRRYRTFGRFDTCPIPPSEWRDRFLE